MPEIKLSNKRRHNRTANTKKKQKIYQDKRWKKVRHRKFMENPVCEVCEAKGVTTPTEEVHHRIPIEVAPEIAFEFDHLLSVCRKCHKEIHEKRFIYKEVDGVWVVEEVG